MKKLNNIKQYLIPLAVIIYGLLTLLAFQYFPKSFAPNRNWLSDLGDVHQNPQGYIFYNIGVVLIGLLVMFYFLSISHWIMNIKKIQCWMVRLTQIFGVMGCFSLILSGFFPINMIEQHRLLSISLYILLGTAFAFSVAALRYQPKFPRWILVLGGITTVIDILSGFLHEVTILEWATVLLFLVYLSAINQNVKIQKGKNE